MRWAIPVGLFVGVLLLVGGTLKDYGVTWDEPAYFHAADLHVAWISDFRKNLARGEIKQSLTDENIKAAWHWNPYHVPHPPFSRIVSGVAKSLTTPWLDKFSGYRLAPALFFSVLVTVMFLWLIELFGRATALFSALALLVIPNLFGFAHLAVTDLPLTSMWFLTAYCFWKGLDNWKWSVALGVVWGLALATKFPAVLIPVPLILWSHLFRRNDYANNVFALVFLGPLVMIATQPYLWQQPGLRILEFLYEGLSRGYRPETNFTIYFFGQLYYTHQLPWYYPFFLIGVTTPEPILALALIGLLPIGSLKNRISTMALFGVNAAFVLALGVLPGAVLHDGVRQLLSALPFLAALAAGGFSSIAESLTKLHERRPNSLQLIKNLPQKITVALIALMLFSPGLDLYLCHPYQLSYYNRLVGGIRGAYARGLETTYFMEAFTPDLLRLLNQKLPANASVNASFSNLILEYYQREGRLRADIKIVRESFDYYLLLNRQSVLSPRERALLRSAEPVIMIDVAGVPLVLVFNTGA